MFVKIQRGNTTVCYTCNRYAFNWREVPTQDGSQADITLWQDEEFIIDYPLTPFSYVYIMNDDGKTIDRFEINPRPPVGPMPNVQ